MVNVAKGEIFVFKPAHPAYRTAFLHNEAKQVNCWLSSGSAMSAVVMSTVFSPLH